MEWSKCIICRESTKESLQCPADCKRSDMDPGLGYRTFAANILRFSELKSMPMDIDLSLLDQGAGIPTTLLNNKAKWHKRCRDRSVAKYIHLFSCCLWLLSSFVKFRAFLEQQFLTWFLNWCSHERYLRDVIYFSKRATRAP